MIAYKDEWVTLFCADAREGLDGLPGVDLIVTDPPYSNNYISNRREVLGSFQAVGGDEDPDGVKEVFRMAWKLLRPHRHAYVFGPREIMESVGGEVGGVEEIVWDKGTMSSGDLSSPWGRSHEKIWFGVKKWDSRSERNAGKLAARMRRGTVIRCNRAGETSRIHPTEKPVRLLRELIEMSSAMDDIVLDPFAGSGSTLLAARLEGRRSVGFEIDPDICARAAERLKA